MPLPGSLRSPLLRSVAATVATRFTLLGIGLATTVLIARALGPEGRGTYAIAVAMTALAVQFGNIGLHASNTWVLARDKTALGSVIANSVWASLTLGILLAAVFIFLSFLMPGLFGLPLPVLAIAVVGIPVGLAYLLSQNLLIAIDRISFLNATEFGQRVAILVLILVVGLAGALTPFAAIAVGTVAVAAATCSVLLRLSRELDGKPRGDLHLFRSNLSYGARAYVAALISFLVMRIDVFLIQAVQGTEQVGLYSVAVALADILLILSTTVGQLAFPRLAAMKDDADRRSLTKRLFLGATGATLVAGILAIPLSGPAITLLFGPSFAGSRDAFVWLLPGVLFLAGYSLLANYFAAVGMPAIVVVAPLVGLLLNIPLLLLLLPIAGLIGASVASSISYAVMLAAGAARYAFIRSRGVHELSL